MLKIKERIFFFFVLCSCKTQLCYAAEILLKEFCCNKVSG